MSKSIAKAASAIVAVAVLGLSSPTYAKSYNCIASWYGPGFNGKPMVNGKRFDMNNPSTVAHKSLPFGTKLRLRNPKNGKVLLVKVTDRGPYVGSRCLDLSKAGAQKLGYLNAGKTELEVTVLK